MTAVAERIKLGNARVVSMRELNQRTSAVIDEINDSHEAALLTKHGRFVAIISPLADRRVESVVLAGDERVNQLLDAEDQGEARGIPLEEAAAELGTGDLPSGE
jgi:antitoxin (DNA-binding transcriptional repressor) of toxin-antitoxin stability system